MTMKVFLYALGVKFAITGVVLFVLWKRRQAQVLELEGDPLPL